jgi:hypothetical protein
VRRDTAWGRQQSGIADLTVLTLAFRTPTSLRGISMKRVTLGISGVMALSTVAFGASAASAADRNCYSGEFCVYRDANFSTSNSMYRFTGADGA